MPVQIQEMIVRAVVNEPAAPSPSPGKPAASRVDGKKEEIVQECVEIILGILNSKNER